MKVRYQTDWRDVMRRYQSRNRTFISTGRWSFAIDDRVRRHREEPSSMDHLTCGGPAVHCSWLLTLRRSVPVDSGYHASSAKYAHRHYAMMGNASHFMWDDSWELCGRKNRVRVFSGAKMMIGHNLCDEKFLDLLVKFQGIFGVNRRAVIRAITYQKFSLAD